MQEDFKKSLYSTFSTIDAIIEKHRMEDIAIQEIGEVTYVGAGIAQVKGLGNVKSSELLRFPENILGLAFNVDEDEIGVILLGESDKLKAGSEVFRTYRVMDIPIGEALLGRVINSVGEPLDDFGSINITERQPIEQEAPTIMNRLPVTVPLQTGIKAIDALIPIGRGQRELILGDRQTGKSAIALDTILNQKGKNVICVYCAIAQRSSSVAKLIDDLKQYGAMDYSIVVVAAGEDPPGLIYTAPYAATTIAEYFMRKGKDVLIVYDDLTHHARAYRQLSLLLRRPPGREAFPGDIFYIHSRLLERSTHLLDELGGGSLTALPIIETESQNISAYIPTNLISITDGQIYLSPNLFQKGILPAVDVGKSVSRVGGQAQLKAYSKVSGALRLTYSQFEELEIFSRFGTRLDEETKNTLNRGRHIRAILKQSQYQPLSVPEQIAALIAVNEGLLDDVSIEQVSEVEKKVCGIMKDQLSEMCDKILSNEELTDEDYKHIVNELKIALKPL